MTLKNINHEISASWIRHGLFWRYSIVYFGYLTVQKWMIYEQGVLFLQGVYLSIRVGFNVYLWALSYSGPLRGKLWLSEGERVMAPGTATVFFGSGSGLLLLSRLTTLVRRLAKCPTELGFLFYSHPVLNESMHNQKSSRTPAQKLVNCSGIYFLQRQHPKCNTQKGFEMPYKCQGNSVPYAKLHFWSIECIFAD